MRGVVEKGEDNSAILPVFAPTEPVEQTPFPLIQQQYLVSAESQNRDNCWRNILNFQQNNLFALKL